MTALMTVRLANHCWKAVSTDNAYSLIDTTTVRVLVAVSRASRVERSQWGLIDSQRLSAEGVLFLLVFLLRCPPLLSSVRSITARRYCTTPIVSRPVHTALSNLTTRTFLTVIFNLIKQSEDLSTRACKDQHQSHQSSPRPSPPLRLHFSSQSIEHSLTAVQLAAAQTAFVLPAACSLECDAR